MPETQAFPASGKISLTYRAYGEKEVKMPKMEEVFQQIREVNNRAARIQGLADKMNTMPANSIGSNNLKLLSDHLKIVIDHLRTVQKMASYLSRPITETSRLWKNGSGQYETTRGYCFREGSPIEIRIPDEYHLSTFRWERTYLRYDGKDYYLAAHPGLPLAGLKVRVREGDQP